MAMLNNQRDPEGNYFGLSCLFIKRQTSHHLDSEIMFCIRIPPKKDVFKSGLRFFVGICPGSFGRERSLRTNKPETLR